MRQVRLLADLCICGVIWFILLLSGFPNLNISAQIYDSLYWLFILLGIGLIRIIIMAREMLA